MIERLLGSIVLFGLEKLSKKTTNTIDDKVVYFVKLILGNEDLVKATDGLQKEILKAVK